MDGSCENTEPEMLRRAIAGAIFDAQLAGRDLPTHLADIPDRLLIDRLARMEAKELLETLRDLYQIVYWDQGSFEHAVIEGALGGWRPGALVQHAPTGLRVVSTTCPVAEAVERDPRICELCQGLQKHAAYIALIGQVESIQVDPGMRKGAASCELNVRYRSHRRPTAKEVFHGPSPQ